ncbi:MAG: ATP-dependent sacrificial sulfur transferase LarE [Hespellia sp.]|nr:ATP-dependent sacrificial sulfur transferase LarE [Hespellia sp.]
MNYQEKCEKLKAIMRQYASEDVMIAFSGGVDSSLILALACETSKDRKVYAVTLHTMLHPSAELDEARAIAEEMGAEHMVLRTDELSEADILMNPEDRCYRCKKYLFGKVADLAKELSVMTIMEGTNEDDLHVYRPGIRAVREMGIKSPLAEAGMTKEEVRRLAAEYQVSSSNKPSTPCLATRFPYGTELSYEKMQQVEAGETFLKKFGFYNIRVRVHEDTVRIEVDSDKLAAAISNKNEITEYMKKLGYQYVTLDLEGFRSGSYDKQQK